MHVIRVTLHVRVIRSSCHALVPRGVTVPFFRPPCPVFERPFHEFSLLYKLVYRIGDFCFFQRMHHTKPQRSPRAQANACR